MKIFNGMLWNMIVASLPAGKYTQVNGALAEVRVSYFLEKIGFIIVEWEPPGAGNHEGEFIIQIEGSPQIFVEVKAPTWESELTQEENVGQRKKQMKHLDVKSISSLPEEVEAKLSVNNQEAFTR